MLNLLLNVTDCSLQRQNFIPDPPPEPPLPPTAEPGEDSEAVGQYHVTCFRHQCFLVGRQSRRVSSPLW